MVEALAQVFPCEFCEISKNTFSYKTPPVAASGHCQASLIKESLLKQLASKKPLAVFEKGYIV